LEAALIYSKQYRYIPAIKKIKNPFSRFGIALKTIRKKKTLSDG